MQEVNKGELNKLDNLPLEDIRNLVGFFALLLKVDKRVNPENYKKKNNKDARHSDFIDSKEQIRVS